jgi:multidrug efflux pump
MKEIQVALVAIALVLSAVFLPMAFFGGSTGVIYRQFSITIVSAMILSVMVALILSPAITANLLKSRHYEETHTSFLARRLPAVSNALGRAAGAFNRGFSGLVERHQRATRYVTDRKWLFLLLYGGITLLLIVMFFRLPTSFLPVEDQGSAQVQYTLPPGATQARTVAVQREVEHYFLTQEARNVRAIFTVSGTGGGGTGGQNVGRGFVSLKPWAERHGSENSAGAITQQAMRDLSGLRDVEFYATVPPAVRGLGRSNGFSLQLQNSGSLSYEQFRAARDRLIEMARRDPALTAVRQSGLDDVPTLHVQWDAAAMQTLGVSPQDANATLSTAWGGRYVNDFVDRGRVKRVYVMGDAPFRAEPADIGQWFVRSSQGGMAPFSSFAQTSWSRAPTTLERFNGVSSYEIEGQAAPGYSSGDAMDRMEELAAQIPGTSVAWSGVSYQERLSSGQAPFLYGISLLVVFLCLAALYESWSIPIAVLLVIPLGLVGAIFAVTLRGLENDVFLQIGLLTTMGLASKNAILMIEFAEQAEKRGARIIDAALEAARIRLRPILMTSMSFMAGVFPLAIASGAGANSRIAIGTSVIGGMLTATLLAVFYIPLFFVLVRRSTRSVLSHMHHDEPDAPAPEPQA